MSSAEAIRMGVERRARQLYEEDTEGMTYGRTPWDRVDLHIKESYRAEAAQEHKDGTDQLTLKCPDCGERSATVALSWRHLQIHRNAEPEHKRVSNDRPTGGLIL